jgi:Sodium/calcium exchanger protein
VFVPVSVAVEYAHVNPPVLLFFAALAIVPIARLIVLSTEQLATRTGDAIGGLLNATFGNAPELIIALVPQWMPTTGAIYLVGNDAVESSRDGRTIVGSGIGARTSIRPASGNGPPSGGYSARLLYDALVGAVGFANARRHSIERLGLKDGDRVLIVGAGTGLDLDFVPPSMAITRSTSRPRC